MKSYLTSFVMLAMSNALQMNASDMSGTAVEQNILAAIGAEDDHIWCTGCRLFGANVDVLPEQDFGGLAQT